MELDGAVVDTNLANVGHGDGLLVERLARLLLHGFHHVGGGDAPEDLPIFPNGLLHDKLADGGKRGGDGPGTRRLGLLGGNLRRRLLLNLGKNLSRRLRVKGNSQKKTKHLPGSVTSQRCQ